MSWYIDNIDMLTATIIDIFILINILERLESKQILFGIKDRK